MTLLTNIYLLGLNHSIMKKDILLGQVDRAKNSYSPLFLRISMSKPEGLLRNFWLSLKILLLSFWFEFSTLSLIMTNECFLDVGLVALFHVVLIRCRMWLTNVLIANATWDNTKEGCEASKGPWVIRRFLLKQNSIMNSSCWISNFNW